ncbi:MAG: hypothetical protein OER86_14515, partial [Phycisphaerae bacterium]|nr:hypothetical protein [Phycisphaerae bacterium]
MARARLAPWIRPTIVGALLVSVTLAAAFAAAPVAPAKTAPVIRPAAKGWKASGADVQKVLDSTAAQLWPYFPGRQLKPILVEARGGPIVLYDRGPAGEYRVRLNTGETYWAQYAFQFAHEFCHILCNYDQDPRRNKWFEESICELASLFVLRRLSHAWKKNPPYPHWRSFAPAFDKYARNRMNQGTLPADRSLAQWYREHVQTLEKKSTQRALNQVVAVALLPMFEKDPHH